MAIGDGSGKVWHNAGDGELVGGININSGFIDANGKLNLFSGEHEVKKYFNNSTSVIYYKHITSSELEAPAGATYWLDATDDSYITVDVVGLPTTFLDKVSGVDKLDSVNSAERVNSGDPITISAGI